MSCYKSKCKNNLCKMCCDKETNKLDGILCKICDKIYYKLSHCGYTINYCDDTCNDCRVNEIIINKQKRNQYDPHVKCKNCTLRFRSSTLKKYDGKCCGRCYKALLEYTEAKKNFDIAAKKVQRLTK